MTSIKKKGIPANTPMPVEQREVSVDDYAIVKPGDIITTKEDNQTQVEFVKDGMVYFYYWGMLKTAPMRLTWPIETVKEYIKNGLWIIENQILKVKKDNYCLWNSQEFLEQLKAIKENWEKTNTISFYDRNNRRPEYLHKVTINKEVLYIVSSESTYRTSLENRNFRVLAENTAHQIIQAALGQVDTYEMYYPNISSSKKVFHDKASLCEYFEGVPYESIVFED